MIDKNSFKPGKEQPEDRSVEDKKIIPGPIDLEKLNYGYATFCWM